MNNQPFPLKTLPKSMRTFGAIISAGIFLTACATTPNSSSPSKAQPVAKGPVIALVLGGGGAKGFAHVGVIKVLEENNIKPNLVVGTSVGSFVGSLYASGKTANELESIALSVRDSELTDPTLSYQGVIEGIKLRNFINQQVNGLPIESLPTRFAAVAAEKHSLKKAVFTEGNTGLVVQASSSVPNIFIAPRIPDPALSGIVGKKYVDGGVVSIVPVDTAKSLGADVVIAVDLQVGTGDSNNKDTALNNKNIWSLIEQGYSNYANNSANSRNKNSSGYSQNYQAANRAEIARADVLIQPDVANISTINTLDREQAIEAGEAAAQRSLPAIFKAIKQAESTYRMASAQ